MRKARFSAIPKIAHFGRATASVVVLTSLYSAQAHAQGQTAPRQNPAGEAEPQPPARAPAQTAPEKEAPEPDAPEGEQPGNPDEEAQPAEEDAQQDAAGQTEGQRPGPGQEPAPEGEGAPEGRETDEPAGAQEEPAEDTAEDSGGMRTGQGAEGAAGTAGEGRPGTGTRDQAGAAGTPPTSTSLPPVQGDQSGATGFGAYPNPTEDEEELKEQGEERPEEARGDRVFAEDWWAHTRPALELHGNFRVRAELYDHFSLGRIDAPGSAIWPRPADDFYTDLSGTDHGAQACTPAESGVEGGSASPGDANAGCSNSTQAGANMRFRIEPSIIISDNLRVRSQIDLFDNLVLGSTALGNVNYPAATGGYHVAPRTGYRPVSAMSDTQGNPVSGINTVQDTIKVNRAWAEYETPVGQARFGRMPDHWGLGLFHNSGDGIDSDWQTTVDRIAFYTGLPALSLYAAGAWDFPYEGPTSAAFTEQGGQPYDLAQFDDLSQLNLMLFRKVDPQLEKRILAKGGVVLNGGLYLTFAFQRIANDFSGTSATCANGADAIDCQPGEASSGFVRRGYERWTPDVYAEVKYKKFRAAAEFVTHQGSIQSLATIPGDNDYDNPNGPDGWRIEQYGFASEITQRLVEDRLLLGFYFGYASGDGDVEGITPGLNGMQEQIGDRTLQTFRFHPNYRVDLILNRNLLTRVQGSYYFKPMAQYDFIRKATGMRLGGRAEAIWTRASQFMQSPGHEHDLGIELNASAYYQAKDGSLNDNPDKLGGFYAMMQYGVLFPLGGLGYQDDVRPATGGTEVPGLQTAQMVRMFLGVAY